MKPFNPIFTSLCALAISSVCADTNTAVPDYPDTPDISMYHGDITPLAGPIVRNWAEMYVTADFIYWQAKLENLEYALDGQIPSDPSVAVITHRGGYKKLDFEYEPGFKVGLGVDFRHDGWDLYLNYTWLEEGNIVASAKERPGQGLLTSAALLISPGTGVSQANSVSALWRLHFNAIDLELGRNFYISRFLALRPHFGLKGAWMSQKYNVTTVNQAIVPNDSYSVVNQTQDFWGAGFRGGLQTQWHFTRNWSIYGNLAVSELFSAFKNVLQNTTLNAEESSLPFISAWQKNYFHTLRPVLEMALGVRYETFFSQDRYQLFLQLGWEDQIWFDQNRYINTLYGYNSGSGSQNLILQGVDLRFGFSF